MAGPRGAGGAGGHSRRGEAAVTVQGARKDELLCTLAVRAKTTNLPEASGRGPAPWDSEVALDEVAAGIAQRRRCSPLPREGPLPTALLHRSLGQAVNVEVVAGPPGRGWRRLAFRTQQPPHRETEEAETPPHREGPLPTALLRRLFRADGERRGGRRLPGQGGHRLAGWTLQPPHRETNEAEAAGFSTPISSWRGGGLSGGRSSTCSGPQAPSTRGLQKPSGRK